MGNEYEEKLFQIDRDLRAGKISIEEALCSAVELGKNHSGALETCSGDEFHEAMNFSLEKYLERVKGDSP